jgi:TolB protein
VERTEIGDLLAERTAAGFLERLSAGDAPGAFELYLTQAAQEAGIGSSWPVTSTLVEATLQQIDWVAPAGYEAQGLLRWAATDRGGAATQTIALHIAYDRGLWLIDSFALGEARAVPTPTPVAARRATPAPKLAGKLIFQVSSGGDIYIINADGSGLHRITDGIDPSWSPDGTQIALSRWHDPWGVYVMNADGSNERQIVNAKMKETVWAADGRRLAYTINVSSSEPITICFFGTCFTLPPFSLGRMWVADLDTETVNRVPIDDRAMHAPTWDPNRNRIVYAGDRGLAWVDLDTGAQGRLEGGSVYDTSPSYSPDGQKIAYMGHIHNRWDIFTINPDGSGRTRLTQSDPDLTAPPNNVAPAWSPDGKHIIFVSDRDGPWRIYIMNADGSGQRPMFGDKLDGLGLRYEFASERVVSWAP